MPTSCRNALTAGLAAALLVSACAEQPVAPKSSPATVVAPAGGPDASLLPPKGILSVAVQLVASAGVTPFTAHGYWDSRAQLGGWNIDALWANPIAGKGWVEVDDGTATEVASKHYWLVAFAWPASATDPNVLGDAIHTAVSEAAQGSRQKIAIDDFGRKAATQSLTGIEALIADAGIFDDGKPNFVVRADDVINHDAAATLPGHTLKLVETWVTMDVGPVPNGNVQRFARGTYAVLLDGKLSAKPFFVTGPFAQSFDLGLFLGLQALRDAQVALGLPVTVVVPNS
jgi:hypothetical protein